ncbi:MAG TPA: hypothetical protein VJN67_20690 [Stellaceae bacterium]|nr:hypothetical protein [Stellaceae bacterium]
MSRPALSRYLTLFVAAWIVVMTWKVYPQFKDTLRVDGRVVALDDYVEDACSEKVGLEAAACAATKLQNGRRLVVAEQAKALLLIEAPLILCVILYLPIRLLRGTGRRQP